MTARFQRLLPIFLLCGFVASRAQTSFTWSPAAPTGDFATAANWSGGSAPTPGSDLIFGDWNATNPTVTFSSAFVAHSLALGGDVPYFFSSANGAVLSLDAGGIDANGRSLELSIPIALAANQTWNTGGDVAVDNVISGGAGLVKRGAAALTLLNANTLGGGVTLQQGTLYLGDDAALGNGTLTLEGGTLAPWFTDILLENRIVVGGDVTLGNSTLGYFPEGYAGNRITFIQPFTATVANLTVTLNPGSRTIFTNGLDSTSDGGTRLTFTGGGSALLVGTVTDHITQLTADAAALVFDSAGALPFNSTVNLAISNGGYVGADYDGGLAALIPKIASPASASGSVGFETSASTPTTFRDTLDLGAFDPATFSGLGTLTRAIFAGSVTPVGGGNYKFGGVGSGQLYVTSSLPADGAAGVSVSSTPGSFLSVVFRNADANTYAGDLLVHNATVVLDAPGALPEGRSVVLSGNTPYIGYTEAFSDVAHFADFVSRVTFDFESGVVDPIIGFDSHDFISGRMGQEVPAVLARTVSEDLDLNLLGPGVYLGTATTATLSGRIYNGDLYAAAVGTGWLTFSSPLMHDDGTGVGLVKIGSGNALQNTSAGVVEFDNASSDYAGGTTLYSGYTVLGASSMSENKTIFSGPLGTGPIDVLGAGAKLVAGQSDIVLHNPIELHSQSLQIGVQETEDSADSAYQLQRFVANNLTLAGTITGDLGSSNHSTIEFYGCGSLTLASANEFQFLNVHNGSAFATDDQALAGTTVSLLGKGTLAFTSESPTIGALSQGWDGNTVTLAPHSTLTLTDTGDGLYFGGSIQDDGGGATLVYASPSSFSMSGASSYSGGTLVESGVLYADNNNAFGSGPVTIGDGRLYLNDGITLGNAIAFSPTGANGFLEGAGAISGDVVVANGGTVTPAYDGGVGQLTFAGNLTFGPNGNYHFDPGSPESQTTPGRDYDNLLVSGGSLLVTSTLAEPFHIIRGSFGEFDSTVAHAWEIASTTAPLANFDAGQFAIGHTNSDHRFTLDDADDDGGLTLATSPGGANLLLQYTPATVWTGAQDNLFANSANWAAATVPASGSGAWIRFDNHDGSNEILLPASYDAARFAFGHSGSEDDGASFLLGSASGGASTLTLGYGLFSGIEDHDGGGVKVVFDASVGLLLANSQWVRFTAGSVNFQGHIGETGGSHALGIDGGAMRLAGDNDFSGGVVVGSGSGLVIASDTALGAGPLTLLNNASFTAEGNRTIANAVTFLGDDAAFETPWQFSDGSTARSLTVNGLVTLTQSLSLNSYLAADLTLAGGVTESGSSPATLTYWGNGGGKFLLLGPSNYTGGTHVASGALIFGPGALPESGQITADTYGYAGLADPDATSAFLSRIDPNNFQGTLGLDSLGVSSNTFSDLDLSGLSYLRNIGTQTSATIAGAFTPSGNLYAFGGGAGTLTVTSVLEDAFNEGPAGDGPHALSFSTHSGAGVRGLGPINLGARSLTLDDGLTLVLTGNNSYTGGTLIDSGHLYAGADHALGAGLVQVNSGGLLEIAPGVNLANAVALSGFSGRQATLAGTGTLSGAVDFGAESVLAPNGDGIGQLTFAGSLTWGSGARYEVGFGSATGNSLSAGVDYDTIVFTGSTFTLSATRAAPFAIEFGTPRDFSLTDAYAWKIASTSNGLAGFDTGHFSLLGSNTHGDPYAFSLQMVGNDLYLLHTPQSLWTGSADGTHYATAGNWAGYTSGNLPPTDGTARLYFGGSGHSEVVFPASADVSEIEFATSYQLAGPGTLTIRNGIRSFAYTNPSTFTFASDLTLLLANTQSIEGPGTYQFLGPIGEIGANRELVTGILSTVYLAGANTYTGGTHAGLASKLFFTADAALPATGLVTSDFGAYVGLPSPAALAKLDAANFYGRIGLESFGATTNDYANLDLSHFDNFVGLGTSTTALISGTLALPSNAFGYRFGDGGGRLTVSANLAAGHNLTNEGHLTLVLTGDNSAFDGGLYLFGGATIVAGPQSLPASIKDSFFSVGAGAYVGYTEAYTPASTSAFFALVGNVDPQAMLGIDSSDPLNPRTIADNIDLSAGGTRDNSFFLGTASKVILSGGTITPPTADKVLSLGATSGGYLVVDNPLLAGTVDSLVVGNDAFTGTVELGGANTFGGGTAVNGGKLIVASNTALGAASSPVVVGDRGRLSLAAGVTLSNPITFASGSAKAVLGGNGTFGTPITLADGGGMAPGNSVGHLNFAAGLTWSSRGGYEVEVQDVAGAAGVGYDTTSVTGTLTFDATIGSPFTIYLKSLTGSGAAGNVANFVETATYSWMIADATALAGFETVSAGNLAIDTSGFTNMFTGSFTLSTSGNSVLLNYTPAAVPEPSTWALLLAGLATVAFCSCRRRSK